jgi:hypothetical protein
MLMGTDDVAYGLDLVIDHGANLHQSLVDAACLASIVEAKSSSHLAGLLMATIFQSIDATLHYLLVTLAHIHSLPGSIIAALVVGALFGPIRHRIQRFVDGYLHSGEDGKRRHFEEANPS